MNGLFSNMEVVKNSPVCPAYQIISEIKHELVNGTNEVSISTGFSSIDDIYKGFKRNQIVVLAGRSSMGKTTVALNFVVKLLERDKKVLFIDLEEQSTENIIRLMTIIKQFPFKNYIENQYLTKNQKHEIELKMTECEEYLSKKEFYYVNKPNLTLNDIHEIVKRYDKVDLIIIDHLTKIKSDAFGNRYEKVTDIASNLRGLSSSLGGIPLLLPAQINRAAVNHTGKDKTPGISDIKGSGEIEENADVVLLLHRQSYFKLEDQDKSYKQPDYEAIEIIVGKNRHGATGKAILKWNANLSTISELRNI